MNSTIVRRGKRGCGGRRIGAALSAGDHCRDPAVARRVFADEHPAPPAIRRDQRVDDGRAAARPDRLAPAFTGTPRRCLCRAAPFKARFHPADGRTPAANTPEHGPEHVGCSSPPRAGSAVATARAALAATAVARERAPSSIAPACGQPQLRGAITVGGDHANALTAWPGSRSCSAAGLRSCGNGRFPVRSEAGQQLDERDDARAPAQASAPGWPVKAGARAIGRAAARPSSTR